MTQPDAMYATPARPDLSASAQGAPAGVVEPSAFERLLGRSPAALRAYLAMEQALAEGRLTRPDRERIGLAVAEINGSAYGLSAHYARAKAAGLEEADIQRSRQACGQDARGEAMLRFVQSVTLQRGDISDPDFESVREAGFEPGEILEMVANIALNVFADYCNSVARTEVDFPLLRPGAETPGADGLTVAAARGPRIDKGKLEN